MRMRLVFLLAFGVAAHGQAALVVTPLDFNAYDINESGDVVGCGAGGGRVRWSDGEAAFFPLGYSPAVIDRSGTVAGTYGSPPGMGLFLWRDSNNNRSVETAEIQTRNLDPRTDQMVWVNDINDHGDVVGSVGWSEGSDSFEVAFMATQSLTSFFWPDDPFDSISSARTINNNGQFTVDYRLVRFIGPGTPSESWLSDEHRLHPPAEEGSGTLSDTATNDINEDGRVAGVSWWLGTGGRATIWSTDRKFSITP